MRPCSVERVESAPAYLAGVAVIRGETVPVLDTALLLGGESGPVTRFVILRVGSRRVAMSVAEVMGTRPLELDELGQLPPLLAGSKELIRGLGVLDGTLLEVLESGRLIEVAAAGASTPKLDAAS
jgi:purine-binding chemotaxis protein CheW